MAAIEPTLLSNFDEAIKLYRDHYPTESEEYSNESEEDYKPQLNYKPILEKMAREGIAILQQKEYLNEEESKIATEQILEQLKLIEGKTSLIAGLNIATALIFPLLPKIMEFFKKGSEPT